MELFLAYTTSIASEILHQYLSPRGGHEKLTNLIGPNINLEI